MEDSLQRKKWIDVYKGLCIFLVVLGHLEIDPNLYRIIFSFHMYSFFFVSGITFKGKKEKSIWEQIRDLSQRLLVPYIFFAFMWDATHKIILLYVGQPVDFSVPALLKDVLYILLGGAWFDSGASIGPAWFLCAMFVVKVTYSWLNRVLNEKLRYLGIVSAVAFLAGYLLNGRDMLPYSVIPSLTALAFFYLGDVYRRIALDDKLAGMKIWGQIAGAFVCFAIVVIVSLNADKDLILVSNLLPCSILNILTCAILGCMGMVFLAKAVCCVPGNIVERWGKDSLIIMGLHSEIRMAFRMVLERIGLSTEQTVIPVLVITMTISVPVAALLRKHFPILVGTRKKAS